MTDRIVAGTAMPPPHLFVGDNDVYLDNCMYRMPDGLPCGAVRALHEVSVAGGATVRPEATPVLAEEGTVTLRTSSGYMAWSPDSPWNALDEIEDTIDSIHLLPTTNDDGPIAGTFQQAMLYWICRAWSIMLQKQRQRGPDNLIEQGQAGILNRMINDKGQRLLRQAKAEEFRRQAVEDYGMSGPLADQFVSKFLVGEAFEDDALDVLDYAILLLMLRAGQLKLPMGSPYGPIGKGEWAGQP